MMAATKQNTYRGELKFDEPMSKHTSWRVGGPADQFYTPADVEDLAQFLADLPEDEELVFVGLGSNLLVRDSGIRGTVIALKGSLASIEETAGGLIRVGAGTSCAKLARYCHRNNRIGGEFFAGIPGLIGGALAMNAGAFGNETWKHVKQVTTVDQYGELHDRKPGEFNVAYRSVRGYENEWFVEALFEFAAGDGEKAAEQVKALLEKRNQTQPTGLPSCGSVFKNPQGDYAARLIEASGLKGKRVGDAEVSEKHANFIINVGQASAADIEHLMHLVQQAVKQQQGVELVPEVKIIGEVGNESL